MADFNASEFDRTGTPPALSTGHLVNGRVRSIRASINMSEVTVTNGDRIYIGKRPKGSRYCGHRMTTEVSLGSSTVAIGSDGTAAKYKAAGTFTAVDTPTDIALAAQLAADPLTADEDMYATIAAADLPTSDDHLVIETFYTYD